MSKVPGTEFFGDGSSIQPLILDLVSEAGPECYAVFASGGMNALRARLRCFTRDFMQ